MALRETVPGGYDQVARREAFEREHPGARISLDGTDWHATWSLGGPPLTSGPHWQLDGLLDELDRLAMADAGRRRVMADFPGWHAYVTGGGQWAAFPLGTGMAPPPLVTASTADGLRAAMGAARESWRLPVRTRA